MTNKYLEKIAEDGTIDKKKMAKILATSVGTGLLIGGVTGAALARHSNSGSLYRQIKAMEFAGKLPKVKSKVRIP